MNNYIIFAKPPSPRTDMVRQVYC